MKISPFVSLGLVCLGCTSACLSTPAPKDYKIIKEKIVFSIKYTPDGITPTQPPTVTLTMGHKDGSKMRDFYLSKNSSYGEMKSLTRQHLTGDGRVGGYFVDKVISKDETYVLILAGQVHETEQDGKKVYSKRGSWMDNLGRTGTWIDEIQEQHPDSALAACGGK
jgi:hypothetical protein